MAESKQNGCPNSNDRTDANSGACGKSRPRLTRRDFLIRSNAGAVAVGVLSGAGFAAGLAEAQPRPAQAGSGGGPEGLRMRRVSLDIDGKIHEVTVDVRESLWETLNYQLGLANSNLGCDRAQCGACAVLVDGRAVNACSLLTARHGRGQKIVTAAGLASGPGPGGLHPVQRALWLEGGFQCGICTRGFVMSSYALLQKNNNPSTAEIKEALAGNICRCGEYPKILSAVKKAGAEMRGEAVVYTAPLLTTEEVETTSSTVQGVSQQFQFVAPLGTIEDYDDLALELRRRPGILRISGSERTITLTWDPARLDEAGVRRLLAESGHAVR